MHENQTTEDTVQVVEKEKFIFTIMVSGKIEPELANILLNVGKTQDESTDTLNIVESPKDLIEFEKLLDSADVYIAIDDSLKPSFNLYYEIGFAYKAGVPVVLITSEDEFPVAKNRITGSLSCLVTDTKGLIFSSFLTEAYEIKKESFNDMLHISKMETELQQDAKIHRELHDRSQKELSDKIKELQGREALIKETAREAFDRQTTRIQGMVKYRETFEK